MVETRAQRRLSTPSGAKRSRSSSPSRRRGATTPSRALTIADSPTKAGSSLSGDWGALALLMLLYTLQGIPMGLSGSIPFLLQAKGVSMGQQARFSVVEMALSPYPPPYPTHGEPTARDHTQGTAPASARGR